jgi:hypothetical protein
MVNYTKPEFRKRMCHRKSTSTSKENGNIVISKDDHGNCLGTIIVLVLDFLDHGDTVG